MIDAYEELVDEGCLVIFGPHIGDNAVAIKNALNERFRVPAISVTGSDEALGEWFFSFPIGSHFDEPIFWADLLVKGGETDVGVLMEQSLVGEAYVANFRKACQRRGIRIVAEASIAQTAQDVSKAVRTLYDAKAQAIVHAGFGFGIVLVNPALAELDCDPPRFAGTAFENAWINPVMWNAFMGWTGIDQYDEGNPVGQRFLNEFEEENRPATGMVCARGQPRRRGRHAARDRRRPSAQSARREGGSGTGQVGACGFGCTRHPDLVRKLDAAGLDGLRIFGGQATGSRRCELASRRPFRRCLGQPLLEQVNAWAVNHVQGADPTGDSHHQQRCGPLDLGSLTPGLLSVRTAQCNST